MFDTKKLTARSKACKREKRRNAYANAKFFWFHQNGIQGRSQEFATGDKRGGLGDHHYHTVSRAQSHRSSDLIFFNFGALTNFYITLHYISLVSCKFHTIPVHHQWCSQVGTCTHVPPLYYGHILPHMRRNTNFWAFGYNSDIAVWLSNPLPVRVGKFRQSISTYGRFGPFFFAFAQKKYFANRSMYSHFFLGLLSRNQPFFLYPVCLI